MVHNDIDGKNYVGQTVNLRKRVSDYRNMAKRDKDRPINRAIKKYGHENFTMSILKECEPEDLDKYEVQFIRDLESYKPEKGYNILAVDRTSNTEMSRINKSLGHIGLKESSATKRKKSNVIIAVNLKENIFAICDSAKLFADYVGSTKDIISHSIKTHSACKGWLVYYRDYNKRLEVRELKKKKKCSRNPYYMTVLDYLDICEREGVETIFHDFDVYLIRYDYIYEGRIYPRELLTIDDYLYSINNDTVIEYFSVKLS